MIPQYRWQGDSQLLVVFSNEVDSEANDAVIALDKLLTGTNVEGIVETIPAYGTLAVTIDHEFFSQVDFEDAVDEFLNHEKEILATGKKQAPGQLVRIPVLYGGEAGPDLQFVCDHTGLSEKEVVSKHSGVEYRVYMLGFMPGFPYLGGMPPELKTPRLTIPKLKIEAGSVGIADGQTGIYPLESPGGWRIIGRTPLKIFDRLREQPTLLCAGDQLRFVPIDAATFEKLQQDGGATWAF